MSAVCSDHDHHLLCITNSLEDLFIFTHGCPHSFPLPRPEIQPKSGKSTVELHRSCAHVLGRDWLGSMPEMGPAIHIEAEDGEDVIHRRLAAVTRHYG
jgi:AAA domain